jgi:hypothetical protein
MGKHLFVDQKVMRQSINETLYSVDNTPFRVSPDFDWTI